jgi:hypothetical protein
VRDVGYAAMVRSVLVALFVLTTATATRAQGVTATFTTTPAGGNFAPKNVVAVWIEDSAGTFVKTIGRWAATRKGDLVGWTQKAGANDADAVSGATRPNHTAPLTVMWDLKSKAGTVVPDGTYTLRMELADSNTSTTTPNHEGTFTFVKGPAAQMQSGLTSNGFVTVSINFSASAACNNGVVDVGETCDPPGSCPATCTQSADACMPVMLVGDAATCTAACEPQPITACVGGDGCCPMGCDEATDVDCTATGSNSNVVGGCATNGASGGGLVSLIVGLALLFARRRR